jgi:DNA-binding CsgD family transcriptional regulator
MKTKIVNYLDYYKLSNFFQSILIDNIDKKTAYGKHLLESFSDILGFDKSIFWLFDKEDGNYLPIAFHIENQVYEAYTSLYYRFDPFIPDQTPGSIVTEDAIFINDLMTFQDFCTSRYYCKFMAKYNLCYQSVLYLRAKGSIIGGITLFRTKEEGDFTRNEIHLLREAASFISRLTSYYYLDGVLKSKQHLYECVCNQSPVGIIAFRAYYPFEIQYINSAATRYSSEIIIDKNIGNPAEYLIEKYISNTNFDQFGLFKTLNARSSKIYNLNVLPCQTTDENNKLAYAYIVPQKSNSVEQNYMHLHDYEFLSSRQIEIIEYVLQGYSNQEISDKMFISINTVKTHLNKIYKVFKVTSRLSLCSKLTVNSKKI